jgi:hypothetical protein
MTNIDSCSASCFQCALYENSEKENLCLPSEMNVMFYKNCFPTCKCCIYELQTRFVLIGDIDATFIVICNWNMLMEQK